MKKNTILHIQDIAVSMVSHENNDYICLTDMARSKDSERTNYVIQNWMRSRSYSLSIGRGLG